MEYQLPEESGFTALCNYENEGDDCYMYPDDWNDQWGQFEDTSASVKWKREGIAWDSDVNDKFKYVALTSDQTNEGPRQTRSGLNMPEVDDEDFIVWMRAAALPNFRKLHRIIPELALGQVECAR